MKERERVIGPMAESRNKVRLYLNIFDNKAAASERLQNKFTVLFNALAFCWKTVGKL